MAKGYYLGRKLFVGAKMLGKTWRMVFPLRGGLVWSSISQSVGSLTSHSHVTAVVTTTTMTTTIRSGDKIIIIHSICPTSWIALSKSKFCLKIFRWVMPRFQWSGLIFKERDAWYTAIKCQYCWTIVVRIFCSRASSDVKPSRPSCCSPCWHRPPHRCSCGNTIIWQSSQCFLHSDQHCHD